MVNDHGLPRSEQGSISIAMVMSNIATILDTLVMVLGMYYAVLDLANAFFSLLLVTESQDQFAVTREGHKALMNFQVLPQGHLHSPTVCPDMAA